MKRVYSSDNFPLLGHLRQVLEDNQVRCFTRNEHLIGGAGELPPTECWPELWVAEDGQYEEARSLIEAMLAIGMERASNWVCRSCGEAIEGQFSDCWQCGTPRPADGGEEDG